MDYRMIKVSANSMENVVEIIQKELNRTNQIKTDKLILKFIGFEARPNTEFILNKQQTPIKVPSNGSFITPYDGQNYMKITSLKFLQNFSGNLYYII